MTKILLVEDEPSLQMLIRDNLVQAGYEVVDTRNGVTAWSVYQEEQPDLLLLDVMLPGQDGFALARQVRARDRHTPILFLTAKARPRDVVQGFEAGGNDYLKKPFGLEELLVRVKVLLSDRRLLTPTAQDSSPVQLGSATFDPVRRQLLHPGRDPIRLTLRETDLLQLLYTQKGEVVDKTIILQQIWGDDGFLNSRSLDVFISRLRKYLKPAEEVEIVNQRGVGYMLVVYEG